MKISTCSVHGSTQIGHFHPVLFVALHCVANEPITIHVVVH